MHWVKITYRVPDGEAFHIVRCKTRVEAKEKIKWASKHTDTIISAERYELSRMVEKVNGWAFNDQIPF